MKHATTWWVGIQHLLSRTYPRVVAKYTWSNLQSPKSWKQELPNLGFLHTFTPAVWAVCYSHGWEKDFMWYFRGCAANAARKIQWNFPGNCDSGVLKLLQGSEFLLQLLIFQLRGFGLNLILIKHVHKTLLNLTFVFMLWFFIWNYIEIIYEILLNYSINEILLSFPV